MGKRRQKTKGTCIDLFAGVGGLSTGLEWAGYSILYANEIVQNHAAALKLNHANAEVDINDIRDVQPRLVRKRLGLAIGELDLLAGGPPCQGFSINAPVRSDKDERNSLFLSYLGFAKEFKPRVILIENVPGMLSFNEGQTVRDILTTLKAFGYAAAVRILYAAHYGIPQMRWRTVFLGVRDAIDPLSLFPLPTNYGPFRPNFRSKLDGASMVLSDREVRNHADSPYITVKEAIGDLPPIANGGGADKLEYKKVACSDYQRALRAGSSIITSHKCAGLGKSNLDRLPHIPPGGSWRDIPFDLLPKGMKRARRSDHTKRYGRLHPQAIGSTILTKCDPHWGTYIHYSQDRVLSVREAARIQSFPDRIRFVGSLSDQYEQVGNAVPPLLAKQLGKRILDVLSAFDEKEPISNSAFLGQLQLAI